MNKHQFSYQSRWFLIWTGIYIFLIWISNILLKELGKKFEFFNETYIFIFLLGFCLALFSSLIKSAVHKSRFHIGVWLIYWTIIYGLSLLLIQFLLSLLLGNAIYNISSYNFATLLIVALALECIVKFLKRSEIGSSHHSIRLPSIPGWLIVIIILIVGYILLIKIYLPYDELIPIDDYNSYCENNSVKIQNNFFGLGELTVAMNCMEYKSSKCKPTCENEKPYCQCEAVLYDLLFTQKGDWVLNGFGF